MLSPMACTWTVLSNHGIALVCVARDPGIRLRDLADCIGVSDRTAFGVVDELIEAGYLHRYKQGNRNRYEVNLELPMRHPTMDDHWVGEMLAVLATEGLRRDRASDKARQSESEAVDPSRQAA
jgi:hypothetical protein